MIAHPRLFAMQVLATAALAACVWLGFVVSAGADSLLTQAFNVMLGSFGLDAIFVASAAALALGVSRIDLMPVQKEGATVDERP